MHFFDAETTKVIR